MMLKNYLSLAVLSLALMAPTHLTQWNTAEAKVPVVESGKPLPSDLFIELAKMVNPTVVNISTAVRLKTRRQQRGGFYRDPFFDMLEQLMNPPMQPRPQQSLGTGFIIREDGLIVTNNHVIARADIIKVHLNEDDKDGIEAEVIGRDERTDIALIKIKTKKKLSVAKLGDSSQLEVGEWVAAFGNPFGHGHTMTKGILSAKDRKIGELNRYPFLQTDASINPGNSGGPLVNVKGEVIGVNTAIDARAQGIGFAIPINYVKNILPTLEKEGGITRGFIGVHLEEIDDKIKNMFKLKDTQGVLIADVMDSGPAAKGGMEPYDIVKSFNGKKVDDRGDLVNAVSDTPIGKKVPVEIIREGKKKTLKITVGRHPDDKTLANNQTKAYSGQKAPFNLGFKVSDYNDQLVDELNLEPLTDKRPVVIEVEPESAARMAGLYPGDYILDINRRKVTSAKDVLRKLRKPGDNILRVLRGNMVVLVFI